MGHAASSDQEHYHRPRRLTAFCAIRATHIPHGNQPKRGRWGIIISLHSCSINIAINRKVESFCIQVTYSSLTEAAAHRHGHLQHILLYTVVAYIASHRDVPPSPPHFQLGTFLASVLPLRIFGRICYGTRGCHGHTTCVLVS